MDLGIDYYPIEMKIAIFSMALTFNNNMMIRQRATNFFKNPGMYETTTADTPGWFTRMASYFKTHYIEKESTNLQYALLKRASGLLYKQIRYYESLKKNIKSEAEHVRLNLSDPMSRMVLSLDTHETLSDENLKKNFGKLRDTLLNDKDDKEILIRLTELYTLCEIVLFNIRESYDLTVHFQEVTTNLMAEIRKTMFKTV